MNIYEITNPSDPITLRAASPTVAALAAAVLGEGAYGVQDAQGATVLPVLLLAGPNATKEALLKVGIDVADFDGVMTTYMVRLISALESVQACPVVDRNAYELHTGNVFDDERGAPVTAPLRELRKLYCEKRRSSMNNICAKAWHLAEVLRSKLPKDTTSAEGAPT